MFVVLSINELTLRIRLTIYQKKKKKKKEKQKEKKQKSVTFGISKQYNRKRKINWKQNWRIWLRVNRDEMKGEFSVMIAQQTDVFLPCGDIFFIYVNAESSNTIFNYMQLI